MPAAAFIAGDWGTSRLRLALCEMQGQALENRDGPGIAACRGRTEEAFFTQIAPWEKHGKLPVFLSGMVGSTIGWREVPYLPCPIRPGALAQGVLHFQARDHAIALTPGLSCRNRLDAPDYMRGEETQILGALRLAPALASGAQLLCLPGTHTKWVFLSDGAVMTFQTSVSGEVYDILCRHSVLTNGEAEIMGDEAFARALEQTRRLPDGGLLHLLFQARSRQLSGDLKPSEAQAFLSGLVIGQDVLGAMHLLQSEFAAAVGVSLIGAARLNDLYGRALALHGIEIQKIDGDAASLAGLAGLRESLLEGTAHDA